MDRRIFLKGMGAGSAWAATALTPWGAWATPAAGLAGSGARAPVVIVHPLELPQAAALAQATAHALTAAGADSVMRAVPARALSDAPSIAALLQAWAGARVVGVMDDASAVIVQAMVAGRGAGFLAQRQHRIAGTSLVSFVMTV